MPRFTILTAVYNAQDYLGECLDSLLRQTFSDFEVICIDDASTDASPSLLGEYALRDSRISILTNARNVGAAAARNVGLQQARGEWILMLDADDWFADDALACLAAAIDTNPQADCAVFTLIKTDGRAGGQTEVYPMPKGSDTLSGPDAFRLSLDWTLHGLYAVRASIHRRYPYDTSCHVYSDDNTTRLHYLHSRQVVLTPARYYYRQHAASMTHRDSILKYEYIKANFSMKRQLKAAAANPQLQHIDWQQTLDIYELHRWLNLMAHYIYYRRHRSTYSAREQHCIEATFRRYLPTIERQRLSMRLKFKPGFYPFRTLPLLRLSCNFYFFLRRLLGRR